MRDIEKAIDALARNPKSVKFSELSRVLDEWFGEPRTKGSHLRTPWQGDPRLNIQNARGMAKGLPSSASHPGATETWRTADARTEGGT